MRAFWIGLFWLAALGALGAGLAFLVKGGSLGGIKQAAFQRVCPPAVSLPPRGAATPPDDVDGLRVGYSIKDIEETLLCRNEHYRLRFEPVWHTMVRANAKNQRQVLYAEAPGQQSYSAGLVGAPGHERAAALWFVKTYPFGAQAPTRASLEAALVQAYGAPQQVAETSQVRTLIWGFDPAGRPLPPARDDGDMLGRLSNLVSGVYTVASCAKNVRGNALDAPAYDEKCGITIKAQLEGSLENPALASAQRLAIIDQAMAARGVQAFRAARAQ